MIETVFSFGKTVESVIFSDEFCWLLLGENVK